MIILHMMWLALIFVLLEWYRVRLMDEAMRAGNAAVGAYVAAANEVMAYQRGER